MYMMTTTSAYFCMKNMFCNPMRTKDMRRPLESRSTSPGAREGEGKIKISLHSFKVFLRFLFVYIPELYHKLL